jgi:Tol biopolymer transport system component
MIWTISRLFRSLLSRPRRPANVMKRPRPAQAFRPRLELLEWRTVPSVTLTQLTHSFTESTTLASLSADGTRVAYESNADPAGHNPNHHVAAFLYDAASNTSTQVSDGGYNIDQLNAGGTKLAFSTAADLVPGQNPGHVQMLFLYDTGTHAFTQLGPIEVNVPEALDLSADGSKLVFQSSADLVSGQNPSHTIQLFLYDTASSTLSQITHVPSLPTFYWSLSANGAELAVQSNADLVPGQNPTHQLELYIYDVAGGSFGQLTHGGAEINAITVGSWNAAGTEFAFSSSADLVPGQNPDLLRQVFLYNNSTGALTQVSHNTVSEGGADPGSANPVLSPDGTELAFQSPPGDYVDTLKDWPNLFLYNVATGTTTKITSSPAIRTVGFNYGQVFSPDGTKLAFVSNADLVAGQNSTHAYQAFVYDIAGRTLKQVVETDNWPDYAGPPPVVLLSSNGSKMAFVSGADLTGQNPDHTGNFFLMDTTTGATTQITCGLRGGSSQFSAISADGKEVALISPADLTGQFHASANPQLFLYNTQTPSLTQVTQDIEGVTDVIGELALSADGTTLAFASQGDLVPGQNPGHGLHVFLYNVATGAFTQVAPGAKPFLSADGKEVGFYSTADLAPGQNPNHYNQVFLYQVTTGLVTQVTHTGFLSVLDPILSADGTKLAYVTNGQDKLFLYDVASGSTVPIIPDGIYTAPGGALSADGTELAFGSNADLVTGQNTTHKFQIFLYNTLTQVYTQVTHGGTYGCSLDSLSADGTELAISSMDDLVGQNPRHQFEEFLYNTLSSTLTQVTPSSSGSSRGGILSADGTKMAIYSTADLVPGQNTPPGFPFQLFLYDVASKTFVQITSRSEVNPLGGPFGGMSASGNVMVFAGAYSGTADTEIYLATANQPPVANAGGPYTVTYGSSLTLDGSASTDPDGDPLTYLWTINGHANAASSVNPTLTWSQLAALGVATGQPVTISVLVDDGHGLTNSAQTTLTVNPAPLTITANGANKTYGTALTFAGTEFAASGLVNGDAVTGVTLTSDGAAATAGVAGSPYAIVPSNAQGAGLGNYTITYVSGSLTVNPASLTITANDATKIQGEANPTFSASYSGFVLGQDPGVLSGTLTFSTKAKAGSPPGTYAITPGGLTSSNYAITFVSGTLTVLSYGQATTNLQAQVDAGGLDQGIQSSLDTQLQAAIALFTAGDTTDGVSQLGAFINHVRAQRGKHIDAALADAFIASAQRIISAVG